MNKKLYIPFRKYFLVDIEYYNFNFIFIFYYKMFYYLKKQVIVKFFFYK